MGLVVVDGPVDEQAIGIRKGDVDSTGGEEVPEFELARRPVVPGDLIERLGPTRAALPTLKVGLHGLRPRPLEPGQATASLQQRIEDLLGPAAHGGTPGVAREGSLELPGVELTLCQVEHRTCVVWPLCERLLQQLDVALILVGHLIAAAQPARIDVVLTLEPRLSGRLVEAVRVLVDDTFVGPVQRRAEDLRPPVDELRAEAQLVAVTHQLREVGRSDDEIVGVDHPGVLSLPSSELQRLGAVVPEVPPRAFVQLARHTTLREERADDILRTIVGPCVDHDPVIDQVADPEEHVADDMGLVANDHVEADRRPCLRHGPSVPTPTRASQVDTGTDRYVKRAKRRGAWSGLSPVWFQAG
ncbi:unannotated protein [freshwater metagenome]|uniref:Unannotated protein n=1 Tax=freshwater metagenome TaxID=449393 RepID=A0A6J6AC91_9ZZZZ